MLALARGNFAIKDVANAFVTFKLFFADGNRFTFHGFDQVIFQCSQSSLPVLSDELSYIFFGACNPFGIGARLHVLLILPRQRNR